MKRAVFLFVLLFLPVGAFAATPAPAEKAKDKKQRVLLKIEQAATSFETIESDFIQEKHMAMMEKVLISKGRFYYQKPDRLRWELLEPECTGFAVNGGRGKKWRGRASRYQAFELDREPMIALLAKQILAWIRFDSVCLERAFHITVVAERPAVLKLVPIAEREKRYLSHILLHFSDGESHVERVQVHEESGDFTRIRFLHTILNKPIQGDVF